MKITVEKVFESNFIKLVLCNPFNQKKFKKCFIRKVLIKNIAMFQAEEFVNTQVFHKNYSANEIVFYVKDLLNNHFKSINILFDGLEWQGVYFNNLINYIENFNAIKREVDVNHNKNKNYILKDKQLVEPLVELGIMDNKGNVLKSHMDKFIQINNFLLILESAIKNFEFKNKIIIYDLCCGKSYLSFLIYYYLKFIKKCDFKIIGVDLKKDVIEKCNNIKANLNYDDIEFICADISNIEIKNADIVVSLHACDIGTDIVLKKAVLSYAKIIISVPCCHKEVLHQLSIPKQMNFMLKYGLFKERFSAILTDSLRANFLENHGYETEIMEFVDFCNSPKNVLIKAIKVGTKKDNNFNEILNTFNIKPSILN
ncbi:MAG: SAM-dependent methyltransferase [Clostridia bacterium]